MHNPRTAITTAVVLAIFALSGCGKTPKTDKTGAPTDKTEKTESGEAGHEHEGSTHDHKKIDPEAAAKFANPTPGMCPVSGEPLDPSVTFEFEGKTYGFCCQDCVDQFKEDPKKFLTGK